MTTNQTIDGVSRALLSDLLKIASRKCKSAWSASICEELRALLDAPSPESDGVNWKAVANEQMGIIQALKAAQPLGEPVAWLDLQKLEAGGMAYATSVRVNDRQTKLYAEQPTPVAVVMPSRDESIGTAERDEYANGHRHGWNAYDEEWKRLNPGLTP